MKKTFIAVGLLACFTADAQNRNLDFKYALQFSNTMQYSNNPHPYDSHVTNKTTTWVDPSLLFVIKNKKGNFHQLELLDFSINKHEQNLTSAVYPASWYTSQSQSTLALSYYYQQNFLKSKNTKWMPFIAVGVSFGVQIGKYFNEDPFPFVQKNSFTNLTYTAYLNPGVSYNISKRFFATCSLPLTIVDGYSIFGKNSGYSTHTPNVSSYEDNYLRSFPRRITGKFSLGLKL